MLFKNMIKHMELKNQETKRALNNSKSTYNKIIQKLNFPKYTSKYKRQPKQQ